MKIHIGADVNHVEVTAANKADMTQLPHWLREDDEAIFGDAGYSSDAYKQGSRHLSLHWYINDKRKPNRGNLSASQKKRNRRNSSQVC